MELDSNGRYLIDNYHTRPPFASFLPGIGGPLGIPLWVFYVNRGQAVCSFGIGSKESSIVEFQPAVRAYQSVATQGFRTFLKVNGQDGRPLYGEPFVRLAPSDCPKTEMRIGLNDLEICDRREDLGFLFTVRYFILPSSPYGALVRQLVMTNISERRLSGELMDGLPAIIPFGVPTGLLKQMANTLAAWMSVENLEAGVPFYRVHASVEDRPEVAEVKAGHFYLCLARGPAGARRLVPIVDPEVVFGTNTSLSYPQCFLNHSLDELLQATQISTGRVPCGLFGTAFDLQPGEELSLHSLVGHVPNVSILEDVAATFDDPVVIEQKHREAEALADSITRPMLTRTASVEFDLYCRQSFLDNVLRGGLPLVFRGKNRTHVYHIYGRRHGDLERDYNPFVLTPEYYSQGNGAYRDVNQNRRADVLIEPRVEDDTVATFLNLIQTDGYNPLELRPCRLALDSGGREAALDLVGEDAGLRELLSEPFTPGQVLRYLEEHQLELPFDPEEFVNTLFRHATLVRSASFSEGYWVDHWTYNLDLIEAYLTVYPDRREEFLFDRYIYTFYDSPAVVRPRSEKYVEVDGVPRQLGAVVLDPEKETLIASRMELPNVMRTEGGRGDIYRTHLVGKLLALGAVKFATLDSHGMGIEMEADKPGWYDPLNGLPALFGSSLSETYELQRLMRFLRQVVADYPHRRLAVAREVWDFLQTLTAALGKHCGEQDDFDYWDHVSGLREAYRQQTKCGFGGPNVRLKAADLAAILDAFLKKVDAGIARANAMGGGLSPTYFRHEATKWRPLRTAEGAVIRNDNGQVCIRVEAFKPVALPLFLQGVVKQVQLAASAPAAEALHDQVKNSPLFDAKLGMYKVNASLNDEPMQIGRAKSYTPGWLENESVFLHMHYKYLLALLTAGLYERFWEEARQGLVPFFDQQVYGRSVRENSSFIVSSAHPDARLHGRGFVARLSGATAEFLSMWTVTTVGMQPFKVVAGALTLQPSPHLPGWLFRSDGTLRFTFLGRTAVTYHHPARDDLLVDAHERIRRIQLEAANGETIQIDGGVIAEPWASRVRDCEIKAMDVFFE